MRSLDKITKDFLKESDYNFPLPLIDNDIEYIHNNYSGHIDKNNKAYSLDAIQKVVDNMPKWSACDMLLDPITMSDFVPDNITMMNFRKNLFAPMIDPRILIAPEKPDPTIDVELTTSVMRQTCPKNGDRIV